MSPATNRLFHISVLGLVCSSVSRLHHCGHLAGWYYSWGSPGPCRIVSCISGLCPLDAKSATRTQCDNQKCLQTLLNVPWRAKLPGLRSTGNPPIIHQIPSTLEEQLSWLMFLAYSPLHFLTNTAVVEAQQLHSWIQPSPTLPSTQPSWLQWNRKEYMLRRKSQPSTPHCSMQGLIWVFHLTLSHKLSPQHP